MQVGNIDMSKLRFVADKGFGFWKELFGVLFGNDRLQQEGEAQQERATAQMKSLRGELAAQKQEARAEIFEQREKAAQRAK